MRARYNPRDYSKAAADAKELLGIAKNYSTNWAYGNAVHYSNIVLGAVALHEGNRAEAAQRLLDAGRTKGSPQLNSFGPDWKLAGHLLAAGETEPVLAYLDLCRKFWTSGTARLDAWASVIHSGGDTRFRGQRQIRAPGQARLHRQTRPCLEAAQTQGRRDLTARA